MKIAVVGAGISGLSAAWLLGQTHEVTLFEKRKRLGGHSNTVSVDNLTPVDTGFVVYNTRTYPNLVALLEHLGVETMEVDLSFGVSMDQGAFEYSSHALFSSPRNLLSFSYLRMLLEIARFYRSVEADAKNPATKDLTLMGYLRLKHYSKTFITKHILPVAASIWSTGEQEVGRYPLHHFVRFFDTHGLFSRGTNRKWRTVTGGSIRYINALTQKTNAQIVSGNPVVRIVRMPDHVTLSLADGTTVDFDHVVLACHADQTQELLQDISEQERKVLNCFPYVENKMVLHTDPQFMPQNTQTWSSWNYTSSNSKGVALTYWMNKLQPFLPQDRDVFVTLNPDKAVGSDNMLFAETYHHPHFTELTDWGWRKIKTIQGINRTWFCGAWCGNGFHEDGLSSGLAVAEILGGVKRPWQIAEISPAAQNCTP